MMRRSTSTLADFRQGLEILDETVRRHASDALLPTPYRLLRLLEAGDLRLPNRYAGNLHDVLSQEICEMALPAILDGGANYLTYARLRHEALRRPFDAQLLRDKLALLQRSSYVHHLAHDLPRGYGFVAYPGHVHHEPRDFVDRFPGKFARYESCAYPVVYEMEGLRCPETDRPIPGWIAFSYIRPEAMRERRAHMRGKITESVRAVEQLNGALTGLGGLTASLTKRGHLVAEQASRRVTTGHAYTIVNIMNLMHEGARAVGLDLDRAVVAVVGAAGSVGSGLAQLCADCNVARLILIDRRGTDETVARIRRRSDVAITTEVNPAAVREAHIVLVATDSTRSLFAPEDFRPGAIVLDDSQPKNVDLSLLKQRDDILVLEAGAVRLPDWHTFRVHPAFGPKLRSFNWNHLNLPMVDAQAVPCCLAEVTIWTELGEDRPSDALVGTLDPEIARYLNVAATGLGYRCGALQCFGEAVSPERLARVRADYRSDAPPRAAEA